MGSLVEVSKAWRPRMPGFVDEAWNHPRTRSARLWVQEERSFKDPLYRKRAMAYKAGYDSRHKYWEQTLEKYKDARRRGDVTEQASLLSELKRAQADASKYSKLSDRANAMRDRRTLVAGTVPGSVVGVAGLGHGRRKYARRREQGEG